MKQEDIPSYLQGDHGGLRPGFVDYDWIFQCLPDSAWVGENWAEMAGQLGKIVELRNKR